MTFALALATKGKLCNPQLVLNFSAPLDAELGNCQASAVCGEGFALIKGNAIDLSFSVMRDGIKLTNAQLSLATDICFMIKGNKKDTDIEAVVTKTLASGISVLPDSTVASDPNLSVLLESTDTDTEAGDYFWGLKFVFSPTDKQEAIIEQDGCAIEVLAIIQSVTSC